jgi:hypothetical protein
MNIEDVIADFEALGGRRGKTATSGGQYYDRAVSLDFQRCECSARDDLWQFQDFIARTPRGAHLYVGLDPRSSIISCGPKGYHWFTGARACRCYFVQK